MENRWHAPEIIVLSSRQEVFSAVRPLGELRCDRDGATSARPPALIVADLSAEDAADTECRVQELLCPGDAVLGIVDRTQYEPTMFLDDELSELTELSLTAEKLFRVLSLESEVEARADLRRRIEKAAIDPSVVMIMEEFVNEQMRLHKKLQTRLQERTQELEAARIRAEDAHEKTRLILDNVGQGFLMLDRAGRVTDVRSASVGWFLEMREGASFADILRQHSRDAGALLEANWEQLLDGYLPLEVVIDQMPKRVRLRGRHVGIEYRPLLEADALSQMIVILTDRTSEVERERAEQAEREMLSVLEHVVRDRVRLAEFLAEGTALVESLVEGSDPLEWERRTLHTLKGTAGCYGLISVVERCHELETKQADTGEPLAAADRAELGELWRRATGFFASLLETHVPERIVLSTTEHQAFVERIEQRVPHSVLSIDARSWALEPLENRLRAIGEEAKRLAQRLGKGEIRVLVEAGTVRQRSEAWRPFWSAFTHAIRNAIDHGLESEQERRELGKPAVGSLELRCRLWHDRYVIELADDGRGVDWDAVAAKARARGLPCERRSDLEARLFEGGLSTAAGVTAVSGRGIGMGALRAATLARGGHLQVESTRGGGTSIRFVFPARDVIDPNPIGEDQDRGEASRRPSLPAALLD